MRGRRGVAEPKASQYRYHFGFQPADGKGTLDLKLFAAACY